MAQETELGLARLARRAAESVAADIAQHFRADVLIEHKTSHFDPVTEIDRRSEQGIRRILLEAMPDSTIIGEEFGRSEGEPGSVRWHLDPIDGTLNYISGIPYFATSIGAEIDGRIVAGAVHDPLQRETFWATTDQAWVNDEPLPSAGDEPGSPGINTHWPYYGLEPAGAEYAAFARTLRSHGVVRGRGSFALHIAHVAAAKASVALEICATDPWDVAGAIAVAQGTGCAIRVLEPAPEGFGPWAGPTFVVARDPGVADSLSLEISELLRSREGTPRRSSNNGVADVRYG